MVNRYLQALNELDGARVELGQARSVFPVRMGKLHRSEYGQRIFRAFSMCFSLLFICGMVSIKNLTSEFLDRR